MRIAVFSTKPYDQEYFEAFGTDEHFDFTFFEAQLSISTAGLAEGFRAVCVFVNDRVDGPTVDALADRGVELIALRCAGFNNVDLDAVERRGLRLVRVPAYSPEAVAEHAVALMLTLNRKTHKAYNRVREGNFSLNKLIGFNLHGKTVGVIGTGKIGAMLCRILAGFGCRVLGYDKYPNDELATAGVDYRTLEEIFTTADIISLHCPLTEETHHLIDERSIARMKPGVMIINTSRGALVNTADVIQGLNERKIGYLGIDVYEQEENLFFNDLSETIIQDELIMRLNGFPNVLITSHQAYFTAEAMEEITQTTLNNIREFAEGLPLTNAVR